MVRFLFLLHRYLGIAIGIVMLLWTLSGIIMMYKSYPELDRWESLALREPLSLAGDCCRVPVSPLTRSERYSSLQVEMLNGEPVLRLFGQERGLFSYNLATGRVFDAVDLETADSIARNFTASRYPQQAISDRNTLHNDQWTVYGAYNPHRPLYRYRLDDAEITEFYISSLTGEMLQLTTAEQRLWGFLGAVIHWWYPTTLRQHTDLWAQVVIWLTIVGIFLTATGLYVGIRQYRQRSSGRLSPYRGLQLYHHYAGLLFGLFTLTWVASGLLSMNPWGLLEGEGIGEENRRLGVEPLEWSAIEPVLNALEGAFLPEDTVLLEIFPLRGNAAVVAHTVAGHKFRLDPTSLQVDIPPERELRQLAERLQPQATIVSAGLLSEADQFYYVHHEPREFPVYRVVFEDAQRRHYYLSPADGRILQKVDENLRWYRWLFYGIHRGDFSALTRSRPLWDVFMVLLLAGVTLVCATGTWMGWRRLRFGQRTRRSRNARATVVTALGTSEGS